MEKFRRVIRPAIVVEIVIVTVVLIVLLLAIFPSFQRAQVLSGITDSKRSLAKLTNAVMDYNLDHEAEELTVSYFYREKEGLQINSLVKKHLTLTWPAIQLETLSLSHFGLSHSHIHPINTQVINETSNVGYYGFTYHIFSDNVEWELFLIGGPTSLAQHINSKPNVSYRGVAPGPLIDRNIEIWHRQSTMSQPGVNTIMNKIILYDPTNGALSHGYLIYNATP